MKRSRSGSGAPRFQAKCAREWAPTAFNSTKDTPRKPIKEGRLRAVLDKVYAGYLASERRRPPTISNAYGWLAEWFRDLRPQHMATYFADAVFANAASKFNISERDLQRFAAGPSPPSRAA